MSEKNDYNTEGSIVENNQAKAQRAKETESICKKECK